MISQTMEKKLIYSLREISSKNIPLIGPKAAHLGDLMQEGFPVPDGIVVTTEFFKEFLTKNNLSSEIVKESILDANFPVHLEDLLKYNLKNTIHNTVAVRSSAIAEDLPNTSFAGMYETYLNIKGFENILIAIKKCWASYFDTRVTSYSETSSNSELPKMAVIIQKQVDATTSGVMFTINPVTGNPNEIKINATKGLGEVLVSGEITADEWTVTKDKVISNSNKQHALNVKHITHLVKVGKEIAEFYGNPQDIEWAFEGKDLYILQTRPVTAVPEYIDWTPQKPGGWMRHFRLGEWLGEPVTPLFQTWLLNRLDTKIFENLDSVTGVPSIKPYSQIINGWYYAQGNFVPPSKLKLIWFGLRYMIPALLTHPRRVGIITTSKAYWSLKLYEEEWRQKYKEEYFQKVKNYEKEIDQATINRLLRIIDDIADSAGDNFYSFICVGGSAWKPEAVLAEFYKKNLADKLESSHQVLLQGLGLANDEQMDHQVTNLDWYFPTIGELELKIEKTTNPNQKEKSTNDQRELEKKAREILKNNKKLTKRFDKLLFEARDSAVLREEQVRFLTIGWPVMRKALLRVSGQIVKQKIITASEDIFFLKYEELLDLTKNKSNMISLEEVINQRKKEWEKQRKFAPPDTIGVLSPLLIKILSKYEVVLGSTTEKKEGNIYGMPASAGKVQGKVRIITSPSEFTLLEKGEILVSPMTGPAWTPLFTKAIAVVTDTGSIMAHASLIAREYGIPAIVGTGNATKELRTGDIISVNGNTGEIIILDKMEN